MPSQKKKNPIKKEIKKKIVLPKRKNNKAIIAVIIFLLIVAGILFFGNVKNRTNSLLDTVEKDDTYQIPLGINLDDGNNLNPFEGWTVFKDQDKKFGFYYPSDWVIESKLNSVQIFYPERPDVVVNASWQSIKKDFSNYISESEKSMQKTANQLKDEQKFKLNDFEAVKRFYYSSSTESEMIATYIFHDKTVFEIYLSAQKIDESLKSTYDLILSSFNFNISSPSVENKETVYKNSLYGFELKYGEEYVKKEVSEGIIFDFGSDSYLSVKGSTSKIPSLVDYHPSGANVAGQVKIAEKGAMKYLLQKEDGVAYVQYVLPIDEKRWLQIEYDGKEKEIASFEKIISTINFLKK